VMPTDWATCVPFLVGADRLWGPFYSARLKGPKRAAGHSQSSSAEANTVWSFLHSPIRLHSVVPQVQVFRRERVNKRFWTER
jgi:hypothetical protein